jgi:1-acyl-sn-glycerol-3-phosphate acyltransferase
MSSFITRILNRGFRRYVRRFVGRNFNAVRVSGLEHLVQAAGKPLVCFANHPGWWDPMTAVLMTDCFFPDRQFAAPMDGEALRKYPVLEKLGFFPVQRDTSSGTKEFMKTSRGLLNAQTILWITPTGKFHDVRKPEAFLKGLSLLVNKDFQGVTLPMAIEYTFWNERSPEMLIQFGPALAADDLSADLELRTWELEQALGQAQRQLADLAVARDPDGFTTIAMGRAGIGGIYDLWRRMVARLRGQAFNDRHGTEELEPGRLTKGGLA